MIGARRLSPAVFCLLCACGGGTPSSTGGANPAPVATSTSTAAAPPTAVPSQTASAQPTAASAFSVVSVPSGLMVNVTNQGATTSLVTPATVKPLVSNFATTISIVPSNGAPAYGITVDQRVTGTGTILYNQSADTVGSIASTSATANLRRIRPHLERSIAYDGGVRRAPQSSAGQRAFSDRDLIVRYRSGAQSDRVERALGVTRAYALGTGTSRPAARVLDVPRGASIDAFERELRARPEVASVERDALYYKQTSTAVVPNDTHYDDYEQWDLFDIGSPNAWAYTEGSNRVSIAMIDTGVDTTLPDLSGAKIVYAESVIDGTVTPGTNAVEDTDGHGTNTAGIAAAETDNASGFAGSGYNVGLQIYKVFANDTAANGYSSTALESDVTLAIDDAVSNGANVINLSLGTCQVAGVDSAQEDAIENALASGVVVVAAAGNERSGSSSATQCAGGSSTIDFPAAYPGVISVGATSLDDSADPMNPATATEFVSSYSNAGPGLTIVAPGGDPTAAEAASGGSADVLHWVYNLYSTMVADPTEQCSNKSDCKALFAGTSQATPHVSGTVALMLSKNSALSPAQIKQMLIATADDIGDPHEGNGRLDAYRALAAVSGDPNPPAKPANINFVAIAYVPNGTNRPHIVDETFPTGAPVASNGTFRIAGVPVATGNYKIGVWYDANGDGLVDTGDYFGSSQACSSTAPCSSATGIAVSPVASGFVLR